MPVISQFVLSLAIICTALCSEGIPAPTPAGSANASEYVLGPDDQIKIWALGVEEISDKPVRIDPSGDVDLPVVGRIHASGLTMQQLKGAMETKLASEVRAPRVSVDIVEYGSQPISVMGAVNHPGVYQLSGRKTVAEVLSLAGGLRPDAGPYVKIARPTKSGSIPSLGAKTDATGDFSVTTLKVKSLLSAMNPAENVLIQPHDVVTVPTAELVYVVGAVKKPGGFTLSERESISVLQALSLAEGLGPTPKPQDAKILRMVPGSSERKEIVVDLKKVMAGKEEDITLRANDVLFIPESNSKKAANRALEAVVQTVSGVIIWHGL